MSCSFSAVWGGSRSKTTYEAREREKYAGCLEGPRLTFGHDETTTSIEVRLVSKIERYSEHEF